MKKLYYILSLFLVVSCMNNAEKKSLDIEESVMESEAVEVYKSAELNHDAVMFTEQDIANQKLQEFYDLNLLKMHHPEFEEDISKQISEISNLKLDIPKLARAVKISNLKQIEGSEIINDSLSKLILSYDVQSEQKTYKDTITTIIKTSTIVIDGIKQKTYKVTFDKD